MVSFTPTKANASISFYSLAVQFLEYKNTHSIRSSFGLRVKTFLVVQVRLGFRGRSGSGSGLGDDLEGSQGHYIQIWCISF